MFKTSSVLTKVGNKIDKSKYFLTFDDDELKIWQKELYQMLKDVVSVLEENNITYTLSGGTCLGAVRHQGFIPWDDDIDLNIARKDYNRLKKVFEKSYLKDSYTVILPGESEKPMTKAVIRREDKLIESIFPNKEVKPGAKMYMDLYSIENIPNNVILRNLLGVFTTLLNLSITSNAYSKKHNPMMHEMSEDNLDLKLNLIFRWVLSLFTKPFIEIGKVKNKPIHFLNNIYTKLAKKDTKYSTIYCGSKRYFGEIMLREDFLPKEKKVFIDQKFNVPGDYDKYLTMLYGNYMKMPDLSEQKVHFHTYDF